MGSLTLLALLAPSKASAQAGREGMRTIASSDTVLNRYTTLSAAASVGASTITVTSVAALSSADYASNALSAGDLLLVYQAQGAAIDTSNTSAYGAVTALNNAGRWQFVRVGAVNSGTNTVTLDAIEHPTGLARAFAMGAQAIRVPQFARLQVAASGSVIAQPWNGSTGGVLALVSSTTLTIVGAVNASRAGFRGGATDNDSQSASTAVTIFRSSDSADGGEKGESIAGFGAAYDALDGRYGRGAPANGGGGGNSHNAGGGGGANGGALTGYDGAGVMSSMVVGASAWSLDPAFVANSNALTNGPGGGRGGYTYAANNSDALTNGPGGLLWGGNLRREGGGRGGRPLGIALDRLFFGGGGGAGDGNNDAAGAGGAGGGLVFLVARTIDGNGVVSANGGDGANATASDAPGGAGAGGTIVLSSRDPIPATLTVSASGGLGGSQPIVMIEAEGPGGGGGGGVVHVPATSAVVPAIVGGASGTTSASSLTEFPVNGATRGAAGSSSATLTPCAMFTGICPLDLSTFVTISTPMNGALLGTRSVTISGTSEPNATIAIVINGSTTTVTANAVGAWVATVNVTADGAFTGTVTATDVASNTASAMVMFTVDTVAPPAVVISAPTAMALLNTGAPTISGTAEANATVTLNFGGGRTATVMADASGAWSYAVPAATPLADGPVTVTAVASDRAGNSGPSRSVTFNIDTLTSVAIASPMSGTTVGNRTPVIRGTAEAGATITVTINGASIMTTADAMGAWSVAIPAGTITMDGAVMVSVSARDAAGNTASASSTFTVDSAVVIAISAPAMGSTVATRTPTITGTARPNATVNLDLGGGRTATVMADAMGNWTYSVPAGMELMDGAMVTVTASAMGPDGLVRTTVSFTIDASTTVSITSPARESRTMETRPEIRGTGEPGATITLMFDSGERATVTVDAMGNWRYTPTTPLAEGPRTVRVTASDPAGNTATDTVVFIVVSSGTDAGVDVIAPDASVDATVSDGATTDASADGASADGSDAGADSAIDGAIPRGTLEGTGACGCTVIAAPSNSAHSAHSALALLACATAIACVRRRRRAR